MMAPAGTPRAIIDRLRDELVKALAQKEVLDRLSAEGAESVGSTPEAFGEFRLRESEKWSKVVRISGMKAD